MDLVTPAKIQASTRVDRNGSCASSPAARVRVDGKFFARGTERIRIQGVTYGPFAPNADAEPFPVRQRVADDFAQMGQAGINAVRLYTLPPAWLLHQAEAQRLLVYLDVPWAKHVCFLDSAAAQREARRQVGQAARLGSAHACVLAYGIGNEIPPNIVRWHSAGRVERFLGELADVVRQGDPRGLVTYGNFPSTEYLSLPFLDFATFNVYLHDGETFRRYLFRLQNLVGDRPLVLGELGMDTLRHGEVEQADLLAGHVREATLMGLAGAFVFAWTDDWHTGGYPIRDWAFGITGADRCPKPAYHALREVFEASPAALLPSTPRVSVVVCTHNGAATLDQCLRSLLALDYPDYEVIVVDDGSTDESPAILARFPSVRVITQSNQGLSSARNAGLRLAAGEIIAYTDSDCFADPNWLAHLVYQFQSGDAAAVGGPNLTPEDGRLAACVAAAPGQPTHVLENDQVAEHIPGCNMAFRRRALEAINGFDTQYWKAGDDVDVCWRLQQAGHWIAFAPGAFVWHHRRQNPRAYLRQQAGYGQAESLLRFKHPDKFNGRGDGKWRGVLYGHSLQGLRLDSAIIYRGTFGTGLFQCLYQPGPAHWAMLPATLEWHVLIAAALVAGFFWPLAWPGAALLFVLSVVVAALQAAQARLAPKHDSWSSRLLIMALCYAQPLVRSWHRYWTRLFFYRPPVGPFPLENAAGVRSLSFTGRHTRAYWSEQGCGRTALLERLLAYLNEHRWGRSIDSGWENWDLEIYCHPWTVTQVSTAEEEHGDGKHLIRVRFRLRPSGYLKALGLAGLLALGGTALYPVWAGLGVAGALLAAIAAIWWRGLRRAAQAVALCDLQAGSLGIVPCSSVTERKPDAEG
jgi:GT2 family glycosyltransferase